MIEGISTLFSNAIQWLSPATYGIVFLFSLLILFLVLGGQWKKGISLKRYSMPISIIIPAFNEEKNIGTCLAAVLKDPYPSKEIVVVDDGSMDQTTSVVRAFSGVRLFQQPNKGKIAALNLGVKHCSHELILTLDADTRVQRGFLSGMARLFADPAIGAVSGTILAQKEKNVLNVFQRLEYQYMNMIRHGFWKVFGVSLWLFGSVTMYRKQALKRVGGFKVESLAEDMDIGLAMRQKGFKVGFVENAIAYTRVPVSVPQLFFQRRRWWLGGLQAIKNHFNAKRFFRTPSCCLFWQTNFGGVSMQFFFFQYFFSGLYIGFLFTVHPLKYFCIFFDG